VDKLINGTGMPKGKDKAKEKNGHAHNMLIKKKRSLQNNAHHAEKQKAQNSIFFL
jgi:hypothetical protein